MSYTACSAVATCTIAGLDSTETAALTVYDYLVNHPDKIPLALDDYDSDEVVHAIANYLELDGNNLTISYSTEDSDSYDSEVFDFLSSHFACLQTSPFMEVTWVVDDSRNGHSAHTDYYDRSGKQIDIRAILLTHLS